MHDLTPFEQRLSDRLGRELSSSLRPFDPAKVAAAAIGRRTSQERLRNRLGFGPLPLTPAVRRVALVAVAALLALATLALAVGLASRADPRIAYIRTNGDVVVAAGDGTGGAVIARVESPVLFTQLEWAPDGRHLAIVDESARLTVMTPSGTVTAQRKLDLGTSRLEWSPDGRHLALLDGPWLPRDVASCGGPLVHPRLEVIGPDGMLHAAIPLPTDFRYSAGLGELTWSPDGSQIAIAGSSGECTNETLPSSIWLVAIEGAAVRELTSGEPDVFDFQPRWLPDGRLLFSRVLSSRPSAGLMEVDPSTGAIALVVDGDDACEGCGGAALHIEDLSPNGTRLAIRTSGGGRVVLDLSTGTATDLRSDVAGVGGIGPIAWTPDGAELLLDYAPTFNDPPSVVAINVATGGTRTFLTDTRFFAVLD